MCCWLTFELPVIRERKYRLVVTLAYVRVSSLLVLTGVNPSAVHVSGEHRQKHCADHGNYGGNDRSAVAAKACRAHQESPRYSATNTHEDVHRSEEHTSELQSQSNLVC